MFSDPPLLPFLFQLGSAACVDGVLFHPPISHRLGPSLSLSEDVTVHIYLSGTFLDSARVQMFAFKSVGVPMQPPVCIRTHKNNHVRTLNIQYVVHVRARWVTTFLTRKKVSPFFIVLLTGSTLWSLDLEPDALPQGLKKGKKSNIPFFKQTGKRTRGERPDDGDI